MTTEPDPPIPAAFTLDDRARIRDSLARRIETSSRPSRFINQLQGAEARSRESVRQLRGLLEQAPSILRWVRKALREAFMLDPDRLLFSEPSSPGGPMVVDCLTDRALGLLRNRQFSININRYTHVSLQGNYGQAYFLSASEVLNKVNALGLPAQLQSAITDYWQSLAPASALSREARWVQLHREVYAERAFVAHALYALSDHGFAMALGILDAPTPQARAQAGGAWERLQVSELSWPNTAAGLVVYRGALHICRTGDGLGKRQVVYLPGLAEPFHEFESLSQMHLKLPAQTASLWQPVSLTDDALQHSALAQVHGQRDNEWASLLPVSGTATSGAAQRLRAVERARRLALGSELLSVALEQLLEWDRRRRQPEVSCATLDAGMALRSSEDLVRRHELGLLDLLDRSDLSQERMPYTDVQALQGEWLVQAQAVHRLLDGQEQQLGRREFWMQKPAGVTRHRAAKMLTARHSAMSREAQLQYRLGLLGEADLMLFNEVLQKPLASDREGSVVRVLQLSVGRATQPLYRLAGVFVVTTVHALVPIDRLQPVVLQVPGTSGGLQSFDSLQDLSHSLDASLKSPDGSILWRCIGRDQRHEAQALVRTLGGDEPVWVQFEVMEGNALSASFNEQVQQHARVERWMAQGGRAFSEVSDLNLARTLLAQELADSLQVPLSAARAEALANISLLRLAVTQAKTQPSWLATAPKAQRKRYQRQLRHCLASAAVLELQLVQVLPSLETFARQTLTARLSSDGLHPLLDIDTPFLDMPDDVSTHWESHPQRPVGDSGIKTVVSPSRHTYSLLQLALHNLDAHEDAPWTGWRLHYSRYLEPLWAQQLPRERLIKLIAGLDVPGQYEQLLLRTFYSPAASLPQALLERPLLQRARLDQFSAVQQGLSPAASSMFSTALAARAPGDLAKNGHQLQLCCIHLAALTLEQPRHVAGMLIMVDQLSAKALLYWPGVQGSPPLTEHDSVAAARDALLKVAAQPANLKLLAQRIAPGWELEALASYPVPVGVDAVLLDGEVHPLVQLWLGMTSSVLAMAQAFDTMKRWFKQRHTHPAVALADVEQHIREQMDEAPERWLGVTATNGHDLLRILGHAQVLGLERDVRAVANSTKDLAAYRESRLGEQSARRLRGWLAFIPGVSIGVNLYEVMLAARRFYHSGEPRDAVAAGFATLILIADVALTLVPVSKGGIKPGLPIRVVSVLPVLNQIRRHQRPYGGGLTVLGLPVTRRGLKGMEAWRKDLSTDGAVTLHGPVNKGSHVKAGEQFVVEEGGAYVAHRRRSERTLRLKNPEGTQENELFLTIEQPREWLLGADAPEPGPGPASRIRRPWEDPPASTGWIAPSASHADRVMRQPELTSNHWQSWGGTLPGRRVQEFSASRRLYRVQGPGGYDAVKLGDNYYEILPNGSMVTDGVIFLKKPELFSLGERSGLRHWLMPGAEQEQPVPATFGGGQLWTPRVPLLDRPLFQSVREAFPALTSASNRFVTERLVELADTGQSMTATRLLNIRATLDAWLTPASGMSVQTDDLFRMLRPVPRGNRLSINIGLDGLVPGLERVDFLLPAPLAPQIINRGPGIATYARPIAAQRMVRQVLERQGFHAQALYKSNSNELFNFVCTHPKSNNLYFILLRWTDSSNVPLTSGSVLQLSDGWLRTVAGAGGDQASLRQSILPALQQRRLVKMIAGIQHVESTKTLTVFFVRVEAV